MVYSSELRRASYEITFPTPAPALAPRGILHASASGAATSRQHSCFRCLPPGCGRYCWGRSYGCCKVRVALLYLRRSASKTLQLMAKASRSELPGPLFIGSGPRQLVTPCSSFSLLVATRGTEWQPACCRRRYASGSLSCYAVCRGAGHLAVDKKPLQESSSYAAAAQPQPESLGGGATLKGQVALLSMSELQLEREIGQGSYGKVGSPVLHCAVHARHWVTPARLVQR